MYARESAKPKKTLTFVVSGKLWKRSLVMMDRETKSLWSHLLGKAMDGELKGTMLETLPSTMVDWKTWKADHPNTTVLALKRTASEFDREFHEQPGRFVLGLRTLKEARSYSFDRLRKAQVINDTFAKQPVVLVYRSRSAGGRAFNRNTSKGPLTFEDLKGDQMKDRETGSSWDVETGHCVKGSLKGAQLKEIPAIVSFTKAWHTFYPHSDRYE